MAGAQALATTLSLLILLASMAACSDESEVIASGESSAESEAADARESPDEATSNEDLQVESGFTSAVDSVGTRYSLAGARVTNPNGKAAAYNVQVVFNLIGKNGDVLDTQTEAVPYVAPGGSVPVAPLQIGFDLKQEPTDLRVQVVGDFSEDEGPRGAMGGEGAALRVKSARLQTGEFGTELSAQVSNPTDAVAEFASWACIYSRGDRIVGGSSSTIVDPIPPGSTVQFGEMLPLDLQAPNVFCQVITDL